ncbi:retrotransposon protein, putative, ty1-copia subclass [Tanacetum coccineum]
MCYYFDFLPKNNIVVARYAEFLEKILYLKKSVGGPKNLKKFKIDTSPSEITSEIPMEVEGFEPPHEEEPPVRRSVRTHRAPECLCLNVEIEEHSLGDLIEPANYKAVILDSEFNMWLDAMNAKMQSMIDNMVWVLVDLPPNCKTVGRKWHFEKKTNMDGIVHTYKAHLVAKGYTQLFGVDYEETFSPMANIRAIRILISIAAFYDYEIWQMDVKTAFLNGYLDEDIYMVFKIDNSKHGNILMQERLDLNKTQGATTPREVKRMQNVPYASSIGSIMYSVRCTRPDIAFAQNLTNRFQQNPVRPHSTDVKTILKYLRNTKDMFLVYGRNPEKLNFELIAIAMLDSRPI